MIAEPARAEHAQSSPRQIHEVNALIVDDSEFDRSRLRRLFRKAGLRNHLDEVDTLSKMRAVLNRERFDVIVLDYNLSEGTGLEALNMLRTHPQNGQAATIMVAGDDQSEVAVRALKLGCSDYIAKDKLTVDRLRSAITRAVREQVVAQDELGTWDDRIKAATHDIMMQYSNVASPEMAKVVRELRRIKSSREAQSAGLAADLDLVEQRCIRLWQALSAPDGVGTVKLQ